MVGLTTNGSIACFLIDREKVGVPRASVKQANMQVQLTIVYQDNRPGVGLHSSSGNASIQRGISGLSSPVWRHAA
jgi:hypothetical protein